MPHHGSDAWCNELGQKSLEAAEYAVEISERVVLYLNIMDKTSTELPAAIRRTIEVAVTVQKDLTKVKEKEIAPNPPLGETPGSTICLAGRLPVHRAHVEAENSNTSSC